MIRKRMLILMLCMISGGVCLCQHNITGVWEGKFLSASFDLGQPRLVVEIYDFKDSLFSGISHLYYEDDKYEHYKIVGRYFKKDSLLVFIESATIAVDLGIYGNCLGTYTMKLSRKGNLMLQDGIWQPNKRGCTAGSLIALQKKVEEVKKPAAITKKNAPVKKSLPAAPSPGKAATSPATIPATVSEPKKTILAHPVPARISERETDLQSLLEIDAADRDSIRVDVYDNGDIDGDSVSVYENETLLINKKMITAKPISFYVSLDKNNNPISHLRLVAESLGSIPPCTALMIVTTKSKRYEVRLSSNFKKNATVELFLKD